MVHDAFLNAGIRRLSIMRSRRNSMPVRTALWKVATEPQPLIESPLVDEKLLEDVIVAAPRILSDEWMLIGRQQSTGLGGLVDLLAIAPDSSLVLIELKRYAARGGRASLGLRQLGRTTTRGRY